MSSTLYFPIVNYKYVRKANIDEITGKACSQAQVDQILDLIEQSLSSFEQRKKIDQNLSRYTNLFPTVCFIGLLTVGISSSTSFQPGILVGLLVIMISLAFLCVLIHSTITTSRIDESYKAEIEKILAHHNSNMQTSGVRWSVGSGNLLKLSFKEECEFNEYYDIDEY